MGVFFKARREAYSSLQHLQKCLLYSFTRHISTYIQALCLHHPEHNITYKHSLKKTWCAHPSTWQPTQNHWRGIAKLKDICTLFQCILFPNNEHQLQLSFTESSSEEYLLCNRVNFININNTLLSSWNIELCSLWWYQKTKQHTSEIHQLLGLWPNGLLINFKNLKWNNRKYMVQKQHQT